MLPSNPMTISDQRLRANTWDGQTIINKYEGRPLFIEELRADLRELRLWDTFTCTTCPLREAAKAELYDLIRRCTPVHETAI